MYRRLLCSIVLVAIAHVATIEAQSYEDKRCKCICPSIKTVDNTTLEGTDRMLIIDNVPPNKCNCDGVILPRIAGKIKGKGQEICPRCDCKYENRNTTIIKDDTAVTVGNGQDMHVRDNNVLNRVGHQQDKWKRQVREQRRNIYDRHTMLN
uniref:Uncharacterized protein n=1 Tax=Anopheles atroparvus TaxID=41427 RepID=A0A182J1M1_ANOAO